MATMVHEIANRLKAPFSGGRIGLVASLTVVCASACVDALFLRTSFEAFVSWVLGTVGSALVPEAIDGISAAVALSNASFVAKLPYGLLMTVFAFVFLFVAARLDRSSDESCVDSVSTACANLVVPTAFMFVAALLMSVSFAFGVVLAVAAATCCVVSIVRAGMRAGLNGYAIVALAAAFLLITVVLCARNHFVTMFA